jgi:hypothetical protein
VSRLFHRHALNILMGATRNSVPALIGAMGPLCLFIGGGSSATSCIDYRRSIEVAPETSLRTISLAG